MPTDANQAPTEPRPWRFLAILFLSAFAFVVVVRYSRGNEEAAQPRKGAPGPAPALQEANLPAERFIAHGKEVFATRGCTACHGPEGKGGVKNPNYVLGTVPALNEMADLLMLFEREDARVAVELLQQGVDLASLEQDAPFPGYERFVTQYRAVANVIMGGAKAAKKEPANPAPPLQMPAWHGRLSHEDMRAVVAYLIELYDWGEEE